MQSKKASQLQKSWGNKYCNHPNLEKEYSLGMDTGDKICTQCGKSFIDRKEANEDAERYQKILKSKNA